MLAALTCPPQTGRVSDWWAQCRGRRSTGLSRPRIKDCLKGNEKEAEIIEWRRGSSRLNQMITIIRIRGLYQRGATVQSIYLQYITRGKVQFSKVYPSTVELSTVHLVKYSTVQAVEAVQ